ncbi:MAG: hypothetical protein ACKVJH_06490, partial [Flavobacteriales bacterium]
MWTSLILQSLTTGAEAAETVSDIVHSETIQRVDVSILDLLLEGGLWIMTPLAVMSIIAIYVFV